MNRILRNLAAELLVLDQRWLLALAATLIASNFILNPFVVEKFLAPDGNLLPRTKSAIVVYNLVALALGAGLAWISSRADRFRRVVKLHHLILAFLFVEGFLRLTIFTDVVAIPLLENPRLYSLGSCGDDGYFVLRHYYDRDPPTGIPHPTLGWVRGVGELEIITDAYTSMSDIDGRPVLFFGDSFVAWGEVMDEKLPQLLDARLDGLDVLNYGVPGYATDQISLRAKEEIAKFDGRDPIALIGILLDDLDRSLLTYRLGQKPYYVLVDGELVLHPPFYPTNEEFFRAFHFHGKSFAMSPLLALAGKLLPAEDRCSGKRTKLNAAILGDLVSYLRSRNVEHYFVIFYSQNDLGRVSSMEKEVKSILSELSVSTVIDTKPLLLDHLARTGSGRTQLYDDGGAGHHTVEARRIIAEFIAEHLNETRTLPP